MKKCNMCREWIKNKDINVVIYDPISSKAYEGIDYVACSIKCRDIMNDLVVKCNNFAPDECFICNKQSDIIISLPFLPLNAFLCSMTCLRILNKELRRIKRRPVASFLQWAKEKLLRNT